MHKASHARHREQQQETSQFVLDHAETISQIAGPCRIERRLIESDRASGYFNPCTRYKSDKVRT